MPVVENLNQIGALGFAVATLVVGVCILFVRPARGEPEKLGRLFPLARLYLYVAVRIVAALFCFVLALLGVASALGWV